MEIRRFQAQDLAQMLEIWNAEVEEGEAFPQIQPLDALSGQDFFSSQDFTGVACEGETVVGLYILHPNHAGRCGHQCNASYAVRADWRGKGAGRALVCHCMETAAQLGYRLLIFNAVVEQNTRAIALYESLGFVRIGRMPGGFHAKDGTYRDTFLYYHTLPSLES